jgi:hypothetical protein
MATTLPISASVVIVRPGESTSEGWSLSATPMIAPAVTAVKTPTTCSRKRAGLRPTGRISSGRSGLWGPPVIRAPTLRTASVKTMLANAWRSGWRERAMRLSRVTMLSVETASSASSHQLLSGA